MFSGQNCRGRILPAEAQSRRDPSVSTFLCLPSKSTISRRLALPLLSARRNCTSGAMHNAPQHKPGVQTRPAPHTQHLRNLSAFSPSCFHSRDQLRPPSLYWSANISTTLTKENTRRIPARLPGDAALEQLDLDQNTGCKKYGLVTAARTQGS